MIQQRVIDDKDNSKNRLNPYLDSLIQIIYNDTDHSRYHNYGRKKDSDSAFDINLNSLENQKDIFQANIDNISNFFQTNYTFHKKHIFNYIFGISKNGKFSVDENTKLAQIDEGMEDSYMLAMQAIVDFIGTPDQVLEKVFDVTKIKESENKNKSPQEDIEKLEDISKTFKDWHKKTRAALSETFKHEIVRYNEMKKEEPYKLAHNLQPIEWDKIMLDEKNLNKSEYSRHM